MQPLPTDFDPIRAERAEADLLIGQTFRFRVPKHSLLRFFGASERTFHIKRPSYGTMTHISRVLIGLNFDLHKLHEYSPAENVKLMAENAERMARIVAITVLMDKWMIKWFGDWMTEYFLYRVDPGKMLEMVRLINLMADMTDFTHSIALLTARRRTTEPLPIEPNRPASPPPSAA
ncbi:hypothetical protein [Fibrella forsythiae]|uniref:Uncharacterized protein n=1 Tax=Fibrella forsythiae TaxID=2817061 RepID=A0ABS3JCW0_9BACT|nr:hypothetical protein [Fibrella forsythiae]MBO0947281.1 hypothetical protein [Fibrella forsythiae]